MAGRKHLPLIAAVVALTVAGCSSGKKAAESSTSSTPANTTSASSAAAGSPSDAGGAMKIGFITKFPVDFYSTMVDAAKTWNKDHSNVTVLFAQGKSGTDDDSEISAIDDMMTQGVKAIAITPTSPNVKGELQKAVDKGIKVILMDNDIPGWTGKTALVATNNLAGGKLAGQFLAGKLKPGAKIAILQGVLGNPSLDDRVTGMLDALGSGYDIVAKSPTDCDQTKGLNAAQDILTAHPDVQAIYGACGPPIVGALQALKAKGKTSSDVVVVGFDASPDEIKAIVAGDETGSVAQFPAKIGSMGIDTAYKAAQGQSVPANVDTGTEMVTKDNASQFQ
jgi:ABC-type sugar transport system substrate-binding protein